MSADATPDPGAPPAGGREGGDETDFLRAAIWFMGFLLAGFVVVFLVLVHKRDQHREAVALGEKIQKNNETTLKNMATNYESVKGLIKEYENSHAEEVQKNLQSWLGERYKTAGIQTTQVVAEPWKDTRSKEYIEYYVPITMKGITRQQAISFVWSVERVSTKMRTIELKLTRQVQANQPPETDVWELKVSFGYRVPRGVKEGGS